MEEEKAFPPDLVSMDQVAEELGTTRRTIERWCVRGMLTKYRYGPGGYFCQVSRSEVKDYIQMHRAKDARWTNRQTVVD